MKTMTNSLKNI